jgi:hypothetical protein
MHPIVWIRIDNGPKISAFDNMHDRPIQDTTQWTRYQVALDVPQEAAGIFLGVLLSGSGEVRLNDVQFEVVGTGVHTTGNPCLSSPRIWIFASRWTGYLDQLRPK